MNKSRILISLPTKHHVEIAMDEISGLRNLGHPCESFSYAAKNGVDSKLGRIGTILRNAYKLIKTASHFKPDIIYFNSRLEVLAGIRDCITIGLVRLVYWRKVQFVIKSHGSDLTVLKSRQVLLKCILLPYLKRNISGWLFLSSEEQEKVRSSGWFSPNRIFVTKNIVRITQFVQDASFKKRYLIPDAHKVLLFVGRVIPEKGIFEVVDAFAKANKLHHTTLIIVGDGSSLEDVKKMVHENDLEKNIVFTGFLPEQEVTAFYSNADILVFPTYFPEGFPMALFNAVGAGLAVITTKIRAANDYLQEPDNCLWVEAQNSDDVFFKLDRLLSANQLIDNMRINNKRVASKFSEYNIAIGLSNIFELLFKPLDHD